MLKLEAINKKSREILLKIKDVVQELAKRLICLVERNCCFSLFEDYDAIKKSYLYSMNLYFRNSLKAD